GEWDRPQVLIQRTDMKHRRHVLVLLGRQLAGVEHARHHIVGLARGEVLQVQLAGRFGSGRIRLRFGQHSDNPDACAASAIRGADATGFAESAGVSIFSPLAAVSVPSN
ncbi:hypothetical protein, partial [Chromobacterium subtsugae]